MRSSTVSVFKIAVNSFRTPFAYRTIAAIHSAFLAQFFRKNFYNSRTMIRIVNKNVLSSSLLFYVFLAFIAGSVSERTHRVNCTIKSTFMSNFVFLSTISSNILLPRRPRQPNANDDILLRRCLVLFRKPSLSVQSRATISISDIRLFGRNKSVPTIKSSSPTILESSPRQ